MSYNSNTTVPLGIRNAELPGGGARADRKSKWFDHRGGEEHVTKKGEDESFKKKEDKRIIRKVRDTGARKR